MIVVKTLAYLALLFSSGFFWSLIFFEKGSIKSSERIINTIILGIIFDTIFIYLFNRLGLTLSYINMFLAILAAIIIPILILLIKKYLLKLNLFKNKL